MRLWLEVLKANMPVEPEPQQAVKMLDSEIDRLDRAVKTFLNFTKPLEIKLEETDLRMLLDDVLEAARPAITKAGIELRVDLPRSFRTYWWIGQLIHQAVLNLLLNASDFTSPGGSIIAEPRRTANSPSSPWQIPARESLARKSEENFPAVFYHPSRRYRHRTR